MIQSPLNILVSVACLRGINVTSGNFKSKRAVYGDSQRLGVGFRLPPLFTLWLQKEMALFLLRERTEEMKIGVAISFP